MASALAETLPIAITIAVSPIPILAVLLMLLTDRGAVNAYGFLVGWAVAIVVVAGAVSAIGIRDAESPGDPPAAVAIAQFAIAAVLLAIAARAWRGRRDVARQNAGEKLLGRIRSITPPQSLALGAAFIFLNPKDCLLAIVAGSRLAISALDPMQLVIVIGVFTAISSLTIAAPAVATSALGGRVEPLLERWRLALERHGSAAVAVLLVLVGALIALDAALAM